ncbi:hypothetical protein AXF42_Ash019024 [Apostasia shenzhenica]|uniref:Uncharacterized protein n=1 Tax=Apostasia shenzhenica TaxID=1088818 RepID=A0A2I0AC76_9ASPA|nr:hypothetical protein AXF42_Ash019024 [Apostasia shenzhenica]
MASLVVAAQGLVCCSLRSSIQASSSSSLKERPAQGYDLGRRDVVLTIFKFRCFRPPVSTPSNKNPFTHTPDFECNLQIPPPIRCRFRLDEFQMLQFANTRALAMQHGRAESATPVDESDDGGWRMDGGGC